MLEGWAHMQREMGCSWASGNPSTRSLMPHANFFIAITTYEDVAENNANDDDQKEDDFSCPSSIHANP